MQNLISIVKWVLILVVVVGLALAVYAAVKLNQPATTTSTSQDFEIKKGEHAGLVAHALAQQKLVSSELLLKLYLRFKNAEDKLQAGIYALDSNMTIPEIVQTLSQGKVKASGVRLTVVEGWTVVDIATRLQNLGIMQVEQFTRVAGVNPHDFSSEFEFLKHKPPGASLEGFLFPDTYLVKPDSDAVDSSRKMLENFGRKVTANLFEEVMGQKRNFYDVLVLASMIEREVGRNYKPGTKLSDADIDALQKERRLVAGVFLNRLAIGIALESDATVNYITGKKTPRASLEDIKIDSPYNTYKYRGLPPTPISNPSLDSIMAAINSADTDYLFFLTSEDGTAYFARTLQEHKRNRELYLD